MPRAIPILVIVGMAIYSFFDVLQTGEDRIRRFPKTFWLVFALIPVLGAALWFIVGRPKGGRGGYGPPRIITLKSSSRPKAPDDDPAFLKRLDEEAWRRRREAKKRDPEVPEQTSADKPAPEVASTEGDAAVADDEATRDVPPREVKPPPRRPNEGPAPSGPGIAPAG